MRWYGYLPQARPSTLHCLDPLPSVSFSNLLVESLPFATKAPDQVVSQDKTGGRSSEAWEKDPCVCGLLCRGRRHTNSATLLLAGSEVGAEARSCCRHQRLCMALSRRRRRIPGHPCRPPTHCQPLCSPGQRSGRPCPLRVGGDGPLSCGSEPLVARARLLWAGDSCLGRNG